MLSVARERMAEKEAKPEEIYVGGIHNLASVK
jgi:hypothetical protein